MSQSIMPTTSIQQAPVPPPSYHRREAQAQTQRARALHINALSLIETLHLLALCHLAVQVAHRHCPPPLPKGACGRPRTYREESLLLVALLKTLWRLSRPGMCTHGMRNEMDLSHEMGSRPSFVAFVFSV